MPSISDARQKNAQRISAGGKTGTGVGPQPPEAPLVAAPSPQLDLPLGGGLPQRGTYPAPLILGGDINDSNRMYRGAGMRSTTFPNPNTSSTIKNTTVVQAATESASAATLSILVNGAPTPVQDVLDLIAGSGMTITPDLIGGVTFSAEVGGTNEFDLTDNFHAILNATSIAGGTPSSSAVGQLGWALLGGTGGQGGPMGGVFPNLGQYGWSNSGVASQAGWLTFAGLGSFSNSDYSQLGWAVADNPGSLWTFIFKVETGNPLSSTPLFNMAQTSLYVGLSGQAITRYISGPISRPDIFIGVRYDTSTTAPSINDSFFTLEVVANPTLTSASRNNAQGTTFVTNIVPAQGVWHTLTISFTASGSVTLTLDGTQSLTAAIPVFTIATTFSGLAQNGAARINWTVSGSIPQSAWNTGSTITVAGLTSGSGLSALNGTQQLTASDENFIGFDSAASIIGGSGTGTISGFPSLIPIFVMGNDDTATPTQNAKLFVVDYFSAIWNPAS